MTDTTKPYIKSGSWVCNVCATSITPYDLHGSPVELKDKCPYCKREIEWSEVLTMDIECNTCKHYDPMDGVCRITGEYQHGYDDCHALDKNENLMWESEHDTDRSY